VAEVRIPVEKFTSLSLPSICVVTGLPAEEMFAFAFGGKRGGLPLHGQVVRLVRRQQLAIKALAAATLFLFLLAVAAKSVAIGYGAIVTGLVGLTLSALVRNRLPHGTVQGSDIMVTNVHSAFAGAVGSKGGAHKCAGCPAVDQCSDEKVEACDGVSATAHH
jgi:hypothetical protein